MSYPRADTTNGELMEQGPPKPLWRNRDYMLLWSGQTVSSVGTQVSQLAFPLLVLALTGSPAQAGIAAALRWAPYIIFLLPVGALIALGDPSARVCSLRIWVVLRPCTIPHCMAVTRS